MQTNYTYYLNLAARDYLISTNVRQLALYFKKEFFLLRNKKKVWLKIKIKKTMIATFSRMGMANV